MPGSIRGMKQLVLTFTMLLSLAGCVTAEQLDQRLGVWVGREGDDLASSWGAPTGTYKKKDGGSILSYDRMQVITTGAGEYAQAQSRSCRIDFTTDESGKIVSAKWSGQADQCDRSIP